MSGFHSPLLALLRRFSRWLRSVLFYEYWMVGVIDQPIANALIWDEAPPVRWIAPFDKRRYLADPFPWPGSADSLLCETYDTRKRQGRIASIKLDQTGIMAEVETGFPIDGHLSFPFVFLHEGEVYALPESCSTGRLEIFHWQADRGQWVSFLTMFDDQPVADAALYCKDDLFWISYTEVAQNAHDNLHLIYAPALAGPWIRHPANPVCRGLQASRNGGAVFAVGGKLYRPAQDCSRVYGGSLRIMEIMRWTTTAYEEKQVAHITPSSPLYPDGFHTLNAWGDKCLVDGMRLTFSWSLLFHKIRRRLGLV